MVEVPSRRYPQQQRLPRRSVACVRLRQSGFHRPPRGRWSPGPSPRGGDRRRPGLGERSPASSCRNRRPTSGSPLAATRPGRPGPSSRRHFTLARPGLGGTGLGAARHRHQAGSGPPDDQRLACCTALGRPAAGMDPAGLAAGRLGLSAGSGPDCLAEVGWRSWRGRRPGTANRSARRPQSLSSWSGVRRPCPPCSCRGASPRRGGLWLLPVGAAPVLIEFNARRLQGRFRQRRRADSTDLTSGHGPSGDGGGVCRVAPVRPPGACGKTTLHRKRRRRRQRPSGTYRLRGIWPNVAAAALSSLKLFLWRALTAGARRPWPTRGDGLGAKQPFCVAPIAATGLSARKRHSRSPLAAASAPSSVTRRCRFAISRHRRLRPRRSFDPVSIDGSTRSGPHRSNPRSRPRRRATPRDTRTFLLASRRPRPPPGSREQSRKA